MQNPEFAPVAFYEDTLLLAERGSDPFIAMKPLVESLGLAWQSQHVKLTEKFNSTVTEIVTVGADGKQRSMVCLPLRKIAAWLYSVNPKKVAPELRQKIVRYQNECDDVLWDYWTKGVASRSGNITGLPMLDPRDPIPRLAIRERYNVLKVRDMVVLQGQKFKLMAQIEKSGSPAVRTGLFSDLRRVSDALGEDIPDLSTFKWLQAPIPLPRD